MLALPVHASELQTCNVEQAQHMLELKPPPGQQILAILGNCQGPALNDFRVDLIRGVLARQAGQLGEAIRYLLHSHQLAPREPAPALELAVTYEWHNELKKALSLYQQVLANDPSSRPALLGEARVARQQTRPDDAEKIYTTLLQRDPNDVEAKNGMAWLALQRKQFDSARQQFNAALTANPGDEEARIGLKQLEDAWRYQLDVAAQSYSLAAGHSNGMTSMLQVGVNETDTWSLGYGHNNRELPRQNPSDPTPLPSDYGSIGFMHRVPDSYFWSVSYENRQRDDLTSENRAEINFGSRLTDSVQWFAGLRQGFPSPWKDRLFHAGISVPTPWQGTYTTMTTYVGQNENAETSKALVVDLTHEGPGALLLSAGTGYAVTPDVFIVHARAVWPITTRQALTFSVEHRSFGDEMEATLGWRVYWQ